MEWPEWLSEARLALFISAASATFTGLSLAFTRRLARNDSKRMKRRELVCEPRITRREPDDGKRYISIDIKNLEPYAATVTAVRIKRGRALLVRDPTAYQTASADVPSRRQFFQVRIPGQNERPVRIKLIADSEVVSRDIETEWEWLDGTKR